MVGTGFGAWLFMRPETTPAAVSASASPTAGMLEATGVIVLNRGQFVWHSTGDPTCEGLNGFADIRAGTQVAVTDASGKALAVDELEQGVALDITTEADGMHRAASCELRFKVTAIPPGVGPYGVEVGHRGVTRYDEHDLATLRLGF